MNTHLKLKIVGAFLIALLYVPSAFASGDLICESTGGYRFCPAPVGHRGDVRFIQKISRASCIEGRTWGVSRGGVWVDDGCRARFDVRGGDWRRPQYSYNSNHHGNWWSQLVGGGHSKGSGHSHSESCDLGREYQHHVGTRRDQCPTGAWPGRCGDGERRKGCKDFRTSSGLGCKTYRNSW